MIDIWFLIRILTRYVSHFQDHANGKAKWAKCSECWWLRIIGIGAIIIPLFFTYENNKIIYKESKLDMSDWKTTVIIIVSLAVFLLGGVLPIIVEHWLKKEKYEAETEEVQLKNIITKDITYHQLKKDNRHKNISSNLSLVNQLLSLEKRIAAEKDSETKQKYLKMQEELKEVLRENVEEDEEKQKKEKARLGTKKDKKI
jgi:hypothetical protein